MDASSKSVSTRIAICNRDRLLHFELMADLRLRHSAFGAVGSRSRLNEINAGADCFLEFGRASDHRFVRRADSSCDVAGGRAANAIQTKYVCDCDDCKSRIFG